MAPRIYLTIAEVLAIHKHQLEQYGGTDGVRDMGMLESAVFRPQTGYYDGVPEEAAALMESLANNHPFIDGNKRVAFASAPTFLLLNGFDLAVEPEPAFTFVMKSFDQQRFKYAEILEWINKNIVSIGK